MMSINGGSFQLINKARRAVADRGESLVACEFLFTAAAAAARNFKSNVRC